MLYCWKKKCIIFLFLSTTAAPYSPSFWHVLIETSPTKLLWLASSHRPEPSPSRPVSSFCVFSFRLAAFPLWISPREQLLSQIPNHSLCWRRNTICNGLNMAIYSFKAWSRVTDSRDWIHAEASNFTSCNWKCSWGQIHTFLSLLSCP